MRSRRTRRREDSSGRGRGSRERRTIPPRERERGRLHRATFRRPPLDQLQSILLDSNGNSVLSLQHPPSSLPPRGEPSFPTRILPPQHATHSSSIPLSTWTLHLLRTLFHLSSSLSTKESVEPTSSILKTDRSFLPSRQPIQEDFSPLLLQQLNLHLLLDPPSNQRTHQDRNHTSFPTSFQELPPPPAKRVAFPLHRLESQPSPSATHLATSSNPSLPKQSTLSLSKPTHPLPPPSTPPLSASPSSEPTSPPSSPFPGPVPNDHRSDPTLSGPSGTRGTRMLWSSTGMWWRSWWIEGRRRRRERLRG